MITQPGALEFPQSLMGQNLQWTFEVYVNCVNLILCVETFSSAMGKRAHSPCACTHRRSPGWMLRLQM